MPLSALCIFLASITGTHNFHTVSIVAILFAQADLQTVPLQLSLAAC